MTHAYFQLPNHENPIMKPVLASFVTFWVPLARKVSQGGTKNQSIIKTSRESIGMVLVSFQLNF